MNILSKTRKKYKSVGNDFVVDENGTLAGLQIVLNTHNIIDVIVTKIIQEEHSVTCECVELLNSVNFKEKQIIITGNLTYQKMVADNTSYVNSTGVLVSNEEALTPYTYGPEGHITGGGELKQGYYYQFLTLFNSFHAPIFDIVHTSLEAKY